MTEPRVAVIIPVFNGERYLAEAINSVVHQTAPCRLIIVDDGSMDGSDGIAVDYELKYGFKQCAVLQHETNRGAAAALNRGIREADTEFVAWLSHDDVFMPEKIERQLEAIGSADACFTNFDIIDADGALVEHVAVKPPPAEGMFQQIIVRNIINGSSMLLRRDVFDHVGFFREDLRVDVDGEMWLRMIGAGMRFVHLAEPLLQYRRHGGQLSADRELMRRTKDQVRAEAIERTSPSAAFPLARKPDQMYLRLAEALEVQGLMRAASTARDIGIDLWGSRLDLVGVE